jgi:hypothetical protein
MAVAIAVLPLELRRSHRCRDGFSSAAHDSGIPYERLDLETLVGD